MLGMDGARDLFEVEAMEPRILLSAAPIDAPQAICNVSAVPETQTASALMVQHSPATASEIVVPTSLDTSHVFGATTDLPALDFKTQETTFADLQIDPVCTEIEVNADAPATLTPGAGANTFIAHEDAKITAPAEPVVVSMTTEMVTTLRAANGPPTLEDSTTPVVNQISLTSTSAPLSAEVVSIQAPILEGESSSNVGIPAAAAATPAKTFLLDFYSAHLGASAPVTAESPLKVFAAGEIKLSTLSPDSLADQGSPSLAGNSPLAVSPVQVPLASYAGFAQSQSAPSQVVIVDPAVPNYLELIQGIVGASGPAIAGTSLAISAGGPILQVSRYGDIEVVVLDPSTDGIRQISEILRPYDGLAAVQILSHGGAGSLRLGNSELDQNRLTAEQSQIAAWGTALKADGDILLYGCDVASGTLGSRFVQNLARTTGADVAASTDSTGGTAVGGDWGLEFSTGPIEAPPVFTAAALTNYGSLLNQLTNLDSYIADLLATESASFTSTELLGAASLGGFLELNGLTLTFNATLTGSVWSGTVSISATSATLYKGKNFNGSINPNVEGDAAITGSYTIGSGYALTIPATSSLVIRLGEALTISASGVSFTYNPSGPVSQTLATLQTATVFSEQFTGLPTATLSNFAVRGDGFSFAAVTLTAASGATPKIGEFLTTTGAVLTASAFNVFFGNTATNASATLSGTVGLTLTGVKLFPKGDLIQFSALGVTAAYSFANFDGVSLTGRLSLTVSGFNLAIGDALLLTTGGSDVVLSPGQAVLVTIASATLSSPKFSGLGTLAVSNLEIRRDGFSLGSLSWSSTQPVTIGGDILTVDQVSVTLSSLSLQYGPTPAISGSISFTADAVVLFPNIPLLNLHLGSLSGSFDFGTLALPVPGLMSLQIPNLNIPLGDGLTIHLGDVNLNPGQFTMLSVPSVALSFGFFTGLPNFTLPKFDLTRNGFELGDFSVTGLNIKIGDFLSFANVTIAGVGFKVNKSLTPLISGSITISVGAMSLFPGNAAVTSTFTNLSGSFDFANVLDPGQLKLTADSFTLGLFGKISLTANTITLTPALETLVTIGSASLSFPSLSNIVINVTDLALKRHGFSFATASANLPDLDLGGLLTLQTPTVTLSNINYTFGGSLSGSVGFSTTGGSLHLGATLNASVGVSSGSYNIASGELALALANFSLSLPNFAEVRATTLALSYIPVTGGVSELTVGASGVSGFIGVDFGGANPIGVQLSAGKLGLALFKSATNVITYALDASGTVALLGLPANSLTITAGNVEFRKNTAGLINRSVNLDGNPANNILLDFPSNEESAMGTGIGLSVGTFVTLSGDFGFKKVTDANGTLIKIGAKNVNATLAVGGVSLTVQGASLGLVLKPGSGSAATTYALITQGGTDTLNGVPGLTLSATGLQVRVRNGLDPAAITGSVATPGGNVSLDFSGLAGTGNVTDVQGNVTLVVDNFVSLTGSFGFQKYTDANGTVLAVGATNLSIVLGTTTTNLTLANASFGLVVKPGVNGAAATYALQANGSSVLADTSLNGVPGLTLNAKDLLVRVRKGLDLSAAAGLPTIQTPGGPVILDFADLGPGVTDLTDIQGNLKLLVDGFASLEGDFGFQSIRDGQTGAQQIAIGATNLNIIVGTATTNVTLTNASVGLVVNPAVGLGVTTFALQATAASVALNGVDGLQLSATQVQVRVRRGLDLSAITGLPAIHTSGGDVTLDFSSLGTGSSDVTDVQGIVTLTVKNGSTEFVNLTGSLGFQKYVSGADTYLAFGIKGSLSLSGGGVTFGIANMSVGVLVKQSGGITTYALQAAGSSNPADTTFNGVTGLTLSASNLLLLVRRGLDVSTYPAGVPTSIQTPTGPIIMNLSGLGPGTSPVTVIQGHLTLSVDGFASLEGDFGFQKFVVGTSGSGLAIGGKNIKVVLGAAETNLTVTDATLGLVVQGGNYALMAAAGTVTLNGVPDLTLGGNSLLVRIKHGLDPPSLVGVPTQVPTSAGPVTLDFSGLGATDVMEIQGTATINVANFVSLSGTFSFSKQTTGTVTKILAGASGVSAYIGTADGLLGVQIAGASLGLVIYRDSTAAGSKYALQASAPSITVLGLPSEITLTGAASVAINTTGAVVNEPIPGTAVTVAFATATNIKSFGGSLTLGVGTSFSLTGDFSISKTVVGTVTKVLIGATHIGNALGTTVAADGDPGTTFNLSEGTLGLVFYKNGAVSQGYALSASATATVALGSALSGKATLTLRRNATVSAQNDVVTVGATSIPLEIGRAHV